MIDPREVWERLKHRAPERARAMQQLVNEGKVEIPGPDQRPTYIVGGSWPDVVPGSLRLDCAFCGEHVSLAPSGQEYSRDWPEAPVICFQCLLKEIEKDKKREA